MPLHKLVLICTFISSGLLAVAQKSLNKYKWFIGCGNNNLISDIVTLSDKSFLGEVSGQIRGGWRFYENYEVNIGTYFRAYPRLKDYPGLSYNKFLGASLALMYEFRKPEKKWGIPLGIEFIKHKRNIDSTFSNGQVFIDHFQALSFGPKIGVRYHFSKNFFVETELEILYETFKYTLDWREKEHIESNRFSSLKIFGLSANLSF